MDNVLIELIKRGKNCSLKLFEKSKYSLCSTIHTNWFIVFCFTTP